MTISRFELKHNLVMKQAILLFTAIFTTPAIGQQPLNSKHNDTHKQVQIGVNISTDYDFRTLKNNDGSASSGLVIRNRNGIETGKAGYTAGVNVCVYLGGLFGLETGVQYSNKGYQTKNQDLVFAQPDPSLPVREKFVYNFHYIGIPVKINLRLGEGRIQFIPGAGFSADIFVKATVKNIKEYSSGKREQKTENSTYNYTSINISPVISLGVNYFLNDKMSIRVEPTYRYGILKIIEARVTEYLWNAGLNIGFYFGLK